jgi:hypothetical protein
MTLKQAQETTVFEIRDGKVIERNLYDKMLDSRDETTTPRGVGPREFIEECTFEVDPNDFDDEDALEAEFRSINSFSRKSSREDFEECHDGTFVLTYWVISSWGVGGNNYRSGKASPFDMFFSLEEAEERLFEYLKVDYDKDWDNSCNCFFTREEALEVLQERSV